MANRSTNSYLEGTAALDMRPSHARTARASIIEFPGGRQGHPVQAHVQENRRTALDVIRQVLESSEMYCSLRYESMRGCAYDMFTKRGVAALASASAIIGAIALAFGA